MTLFKNKRFWIWLLIIFLVVTSIKGCYECFLKGRKNLEVLHSFSLIESRQRGIFVAEFEAVPSSIESKQIKISIIECWLEEEVYESFLFVWFPCIVRTGKCSICFRTVEDCGTILSDQQGEHFSTIGKLHWIEVDNRNYQQCLITEVISPDKQREAVRIELKRK